MIPGDVLDAADVARAVAGQEVVLSLFGVPYSWKPISVYSQGMKNILAAMKASGVDRLVCVTSGGTRPRYDPEEGFVFGRIIKPLFGRTLYEDMRRMEELVMQSDRDWTIVRPANRRRAIASGGRRSRSRQRHNCDEARGDALRSGIKLRSLMAGAFGCACVT